MVAGDADVVDTVPIGDQEDDQDEIDEILDGTALDKANSDADTTEGTEAAL